ncbi:hypothetical protein ACQBAR_16530 [Propionibacteriaceae bacterium Y1685]
MSQPQQPPNPYSAPQQQNNEPGGHVGPGGQLPSPTQGPMGSPLATGKPRRTSIIVGIAAAAIVIILMMAGMAIVLLNA